MKYLKTMGFSLLALIFGFFGLSLVFADLGGGESMTARILVAVVFFFLTGAAIGFFNPTLWMISGLTAWGGIFMGGFLTLTAIRRYGGTAFAAQEPPYITPGLIMLFLPVTFSLIGGYLGKRFAERRMSSVTRSP